MKITEALERATQRRGRREIWDDDRFREVREHDLEQPTIAVRSVIGATALCLVLAALLTSSKLVQIAERQPIGPARDRWVEIAGAVDRTANFLSLNRPFDLIEDLRGAGETAGRRLDTIDQVVAEAGLATTTVGRPSGRAVPEPASDSEPTPAPASSSPPATTSAPPPLRTITAADPLRVLVAGDSQAEFLGQAIINDAGRRALDVETEHQLSSSLARPDYFNWPAELVSALEAGDPEAVVLFLGANDFQDMVGPDGDRLVRASEEWQREWSRRLGLMLDLIAATHRHVVWVGQPPMRDATLDEGVDLVNDLAAAVIAARSDVAYLDIWERFGGDGPYRERVVGPDGELRRARVDDGVHLNRTAAGWVAAAVLEILDGAWTFERG
ncbi:MAG: DUF459 domain-containing protein [Acidimicrobiales bacterium]